MARKHSLETGDRVAYAAKWLKNTGQHTGDAPRRRGTVTGRNARTSGLVYVRWDDDVADDYASIREMYADDPEYVAHVIERGTGVMEANLAKVRDKRGRPTTPNMDFSDAG